MGESHWRLVASLIRPYRRAFAGHGLLMAVATSIPIVASLLMARFVELAVDGASFATLAPYAIGFAVSGLLASLVNILVTWRSTVLAWRVTNGLRHELASHVLYADLSFHRDRTPGELLTRCDADVTSLTTFLASVVARLIGIALLATISTIVLFVVEPVLAPVVAIGYVVLGLMMWFRRDRSTAATVAERTTDAEMNSAVEQYLAGADDVATLGAGAHGLRRFAEPAGRLVSAAQERVRAEMALSASLRTTIAMTQVAVLATGGLALQRSWVGLGAVVFAYRLVDVVRQSVDHLTWRLQEAQGVAGAASRVLQLLDERRRVVSGTALLPAGPLGLRFDTVGLVYDDASSGESALTEFTLDIPPCRVVGLVGRTGSGKTTVARLALRLVAPTSGSLTIGRTDITTLDDGAFRSRVGAIPQDVQLFPGTVRENVAMFSPVDDARIISALEDAGLNGWYTGLPDGLDTVLSADGRSEDEDRTGLSSGEAQLLAIARALLRQPDIVVLDEATSRVDPQTQRSIAEALGRLVAGRTGVIIAHRLETLDICDDIAVLADGELVEYGARVALAADPTSRYAHLRAVGAEAEELA